MDTGFLFPSTVVSDNSVGVNAWTSPGNASADDGTPTSCVTHTSTSSGNVDDIVRLVIGGSISGTDLSNEQSFTSAGNKTFGGATELWGLTPSYSDINASTFGVVLSVRNTFGGSQTPSQYLKATNFGFSIPTGATINGIEVLFDVNAAATASVKIDSVQIKVYYSLSDNAQRAAETHGSDTAQATRSAEIHGYADTSTTRPAETHGEASTSTTRAAETHGQATDSATRPAEVHGQDTSNATRPAEVHGSQIVSTSRSAEIDGQSAGGTASTTRAAETTGAFSWTIQRRKDGGAWADIETAIPILDATGTYTYTDTGPFDAGAEYCYRVKNVDPDDSNYSNIDCEIFAATSSTTRAAEVHGQDTATDTRPAETHGQDTASASRAAEVTGQAASTTGNIKYFNGSTYEVKQLKRWNGSSWADTPIHKYNGSTWDTLSY